MNSRYSHHRHTSPRSISPPKLLIANSIPHLLHGSEYGDRASPHALTSELLVDALNKHEHFNLVAGVSTAEDVLKSAQSADFDFVLIRANLPDGPLGGIGALRQLRGCSPQVKAVILLEGRESDLVVDAFRAGARGVFNLSGSSFEELCKCVEQVYAGQTWANSGELSEVIEAFSQLAPMRVVNSDGIRLLTKREEDVVRPWQRVYKIGSLLPPVYEDNPDLSR